jgi:hypothetical protein
MSSPMKEVRRPEKASVLSKLESVSFDMFYRIIHTGGHSRNSRKLPRYLRVEDVGAISLFRRVYPRALKNVEAGHLHTSQ